MQFMGVDPPPPTVVDIAGQGVESQVALDQLSRLP